MRRAIDYLPRRAEALVREALEDTRVVVVNGARQVGKSTLAEAVLRAADRGSWMIRSPARRRLPTPSGFWSTTACC